jgi:hypothetical protein
VTWIATLHPENAQVAIDPRFLTAGNPWMAVYEETCKDMGRRRSNATPYPDATAPPAYNEEGSGEGQYEVCQKKKYSGILDFTIGYTLVVVCVVLTIVTEIHSMIAYFCSWVCSKAVNWCSPMGLLSWLPFIIAYSLKLAFQMLDIAMLLSGILVVEGIAAANCIICTILGCSFEVGQSMHQMTRKTPHIVRWAFRRRFDTRRCHSTTGSNANGTESVANAV